ncbi:aromatic acid/H+ symport family MFS transporter [Desulfovibrio sp. OttesenSCG-928-C06]|nr:aromatic acid/H+ symport family MFS transporter [Desulfovibrio sp. OttesenSCG-928-C06]
MATAEKVDICTFLDARPISRTTWGMLFISFIILMFDGFDTAVMAFLAPPLREAWGIDNTALGPVVMSGLVGLAVGALTAGPLADRLGRKVVVVGSIFFFGVWSLVSAFSDSVAALCFWRFLTGMGLGASMPNTVTLISEYAPKRYRSWMVTVIYCGFSAGAALCGLVTTILVAHWDWRAVLVAGGVVPILFACYLWFTLPESTRFLVLKPERRQRLLAVVNRLVPGLADENTEFYTSEVRVGTKNTVGVLLKPEYRLGTVTLWVAMLSILFANYLLSTWMPSVAKASGMDMAHWALVGATFQIGGVFGNFFVGMVMDKIEHHKVLAGAVVLGGLFAVILAQLHLTLSSMVPLVFLIGVTVSCVSTGLFALAAHTYPTEVRATGVSWAAGIGRLGSITGSGSGALILGLNYEPSAIFMFALIPLGISAAAIIVKGIRQPSYSR